MTEKVENCFLFQYDTSDNYQMNWFQLTWLWWIF